MSTEQLWELARTTLRDAQGMGAEEATVSLSRQTEVNLTRRAGRLEQATQATSLSLSLSPATSIRSPHYTLPLAVFLFSGANCLPTLTAERVNFLINQF